MSFTTTDLIDENTEALLQKVWSTLDSALMSYNRGDNVDMVSVDKYTRDFCQQLNNLSPRQAKHYAPKLQDVIKHLYQLTEELKQNSIAINEQLEALDVSSFAQNAYANAARLNKD